MSMKVVSLKASNYKRLKAVEITPDPDAAVVTISGRNAQGKTSVLDAIWAALAGREASAATKRPIRDGESQASVRVDLGDYIVTRKWSKDDAGTLTVEAPDGAKYSSPQKLLDEVVGARAFDPLEFTRQSAREQVATLVSTVTLPFDPAELERDRKAVFDARTDVNRDVARLEAQLKAFPAADTSLPDIEVSAADLVAEVEEARAHNRAVDSEVERIESLEHVKEHAAAEVERALTALQDAKRALQDAVDACGAQAALVESLPERKDVDAITARLASAEQVNARIREQHQRQRVADDLHERQNASAAHTLKLKEIEKRKADALAAVEFPVSGLSFDDTGVTYNGVPFAQASSAEQLRVSVALAMAANPTLRVLRVMDGSLLDAESMAVIGEMAAESDYQVWVEVVDSTGKVGVTIEDGAVA